MQLTLTPYLLSEKGRHEYQIAHGTASRWTVLSRRAEHMAHATLGCVPMIAAITSAVLLLQNHTFAGIYTSIHRVVSAYNPNVGISSELIKGLNSLPSVLTEELGRHRGGMTSATGWEFLAVGIAAVECNGLIKRVIPKAWKYNESEWVTHFLGIFNPQEMARQVYEEELRRRLAQIVTVITFGILPLIGAVVGVNALRAR